MEFNLADLFEQAVDHFGDRECLIANGERRTYRQMEERANQLAHHLAAQGIGPGDHVGIYAYNRVEWVETLWAVFKIRAVWININYRYVEEELSYIFDNADLKALVYERNWAPRVRHCLDALPQLEHTIVVEDDSGADLEGLDSVPYEDALAGRSTERDFGPRSGDDLYILYTGGTTGMPKGVMWEHEKVFMALGGGIDAITLERVDRPEQMVDKAFPDPLVFYFIAPLMHGASQWGLMGQTFVGHTVVLSAQFDPAEAWRLIETEKINSLMVTGDAMARPLIEELEANRDDYDVSSLISLSSSAAVFTPSVKDRWFAQFPDLVLTDSIGASESGNNGLLTVSKDNTKMEGGPRVTPGRDAVVLDEDLTLMEPGTGEIGKLARSGDIPLGYYKDEQKTAETFVTAADGVRYAIAGDWARLEEDGTITLLGRGSVSINSGGEKIFPEEVEGAVKAHPAVFDATVVGAPDDTWGSRVAAVIQLRDGHDGVDLADLQAECRKHIAGFKIPRQIHVVDQIVRAPSGKPDYRWAKSVAETDPDAIDPAYTKA